MYWLLELLEMISIVFSLRCFTEVCRILSLLYLLPLLQMYPAGVCGLLSLLYLSFAVVYLLGNSHIPERDRERQRESCPSGIAFIFVVD